MIFNGVQFSINYPVLFVLAILLSIFVIAGNLLIIVAVSREAFLQRSVCNYYIVSLAVADLLVGLLVIPFSALYEFSSRTWLFGDLFCDIWYSIDIFTCTSSILNLVRRNSSMYIIEARRVSLIVYVFFPAKSIRRPHIKVSCRQSFLCEHSS